MNPSAPSRDAMHDLVVPGAVPFWPATPAWYGVFAVLALLAAWCGWRAWQHWRRNAYRREALRDLRQAAPPEVAAILKRAALAAWPRERVAALAGADWAAFLRRTAPRAGLDEATAGALAELAYAPGPANLRNAAARWIRCHDPRR